MNTALPTYVLINPASRSGYSVRVWEQVRPMFEERGVKAKILFSRRDSGMTTLVRDVTESGEEVNLIAMGGDGTLNEVINGIRDFSKVYLGYIPTGSSNDYARSIGTEDPVEAAKRILECGEPVMADLGEMSYLEEATKTWHRRYFNDANGFGFDAASCAAVDASHIKKLFNALHIGKLVYIFVAIRLIMTSRLCSFELSIKNGGTTEHFKYKKALFIVCMNYAYEGGGFQFCPDADGTDGKFDIMVAADVGRLRFFRIFPRAYDGSHTHMSGIEIKQAEQAVIRVDEPQFFHTDGEASVKTREIMVKLRPGLVRWLR